MVLYKKFKPLVDGQSFDHIFYTGPIDAYFNYQYGRLGYRTVIFKKSYASGDFQGATQINFCDENIPHTRITEHKHFTPWEQHDSTVYFTEFSKETGPDDTPFYPKRLTADKALLLQYRHLAAQQYAVSFLGRLATYRYMDMHHVIDEAMQMAQLFISSKQQNERPPVFVNIEFA